MASPRAGWLWWGAMAVVVVVVAGVVGASRLGVLAAQVAGTPAPVEVERVDVPVDRATDLRIDAWWTVHIPSGGVRVDSTLTVAHPPAPGGPAGSRPLATAVLRLSSGQPAVPWTFTLRRDRPLPADQVLYLVDDTGDGAAYGTEPVTDRVSQATATAATMSADRRTGTVEVPHLSFFQWLVDLPSVASNAVGKFFGQRSEPPGCPAARPAWLTDAIFVADRNAPMLVCVGGDPDKPDLAVVKVVNNRGGALLVTAPVVPDWAWQSFVGKEMESWASNLLTHVVEYLGVPPANAARTWILPPGQEVDLGFSRATLGARSPAEVTGAFSPTSMVLGLTSKAVSDVLDEGARGWDFVLMGACLESMGTRVVDDSSAAGLAQGLASLARCVVEQPETVIQVLRRLLPAAVWQKMSGTVFRVANLAKKALTRYLALAEATFTVADVVTTLALPRSAFTVSLFAKQEVVATKVVAIAAVAKAGGPAPGYTVETTTGGPVDNCTSSPAARDPGIVACSPSAAGADVCWVQPDRVTLLCGGDPWEKKLYQNLSGQQVGDLPTGDYEPEPWGLELAGGLRCRLRNGGSWGGRADGYVGAYYCGDENQFVLAAADEPLIARNGPQWTVKVGSLGAPDENFPPPKAVRVVTAYFAAMP